MFKKYTVVLFAAALIFMSAGCQNKGEKAGPQIKLWHGYENLIQSEETLKKEIDQKMQRLQAFLEENKLEGMLLTQVRNVYWITAGMANNQIVLNKDVGAASLLIMKDGKKYLLANGSESGRMMDEVLSDLGYELKFYNWYEANPQKDVRGKIIRELAGSGIGIIGSDVNYPGTVNMAVEFEPIRYQLLPSEIERYKWLGEKTTEAVVEVCKVIEPGMNEYEIEALTSAALRARGIFPTVLLIAVDQRVYDYRHALPAGAVLEKYAMVNVVAEKWGMPMAVTRFVHFGELPEELKSKLEKTAIVNAHFQKATKPGVSGADIFEKCKEWYAAVGYEGEWKLHHQGGAIGYNDREWVIYPGIEKSVLNNQAFAWNPTITGAKVEETIIVNEEGFDVVTKTEDWPVINVVLDGKEYPQPSILIRDPESGDVVKVDDYKVEQ